MINDTETPTLYWNRNGRIACEKHAPVRDDSLWKLEDWRPMSAFASLPGADLLCENCRKEDA